MPYSVQHKDYYTNFNPSSFLKLKELGLRVDVSFGYLDLLDAAVFWMTNVEREKNGLAPFQFHYKLRQMAILHSEQMRLHKFFSHENPYEARYKTLDDRLDAMKDGSFDGFMTWGENIAQYPTLNGPNSFSVEFRNGIPYFFAPDGSEILHCTCKEFAYKVVDGWMHSPGHRANILNPKFEYLGCGCAGFEQKGNSVSLLYFNLTQNFGGGLVSAFSKDVRGTFNPRASDTSTTTNSKSNASFGGWRQSKITEMEDNIMQGDIMPDNGYSPENGEEKTLCVFLLDNSGSMSGNNKIVSLNQGLQQFYNDIVADEVLSQKVEVAVISFESQVRYLQQPALVQDFTMPTLQAIGGTDMVGGIKKAIEVVNERKKYWVEHGIAYKRPWIVMITDGYANVDSIKDQVKQESAAKHYFLLPIAIDDQADMNVLNSVASDRAFKLKDNGKFSAFFRWLSNSMGTIANANPDANVNLENPFAGWAV